MRPRDELVTSSALPPVTNGDEALERLMAGNARFADDASVNQGQDPVRRAETAEAQNPFAVILGCSDSRVPPEILFDEGIGDIFTVRIAGNSASDPIVVGSIEFAAEFLGSVLVVVLGHENCGAVMATIQRLQGGSTQHGQIGAVVDPLIPAVREVIDQPAETLVDAAVKANIRLQVQRLTSSRAVLEPLITAGKVKVVGAVYHLLTGRVELVA